MLVKRIEHKCYKLYVCAFINILLICLRRWSAPSWCFSATTGGSSSPSFRNRTTRTSRWRRAWSSRPPISLSTMSATSPTCTSAARTACRAATMSLPKSSKTLTSPQEVMKAWKFYSSLWFLLGWATETKTQMY